MKTVTLILSCLLSATTMSSCNNLKYEQATNTDNTEVVQSVERKKRPIKYFPIKDPQKNMLMALMPIPSDWKMSDKKKDNIFLEGPNGVETF